MRRNESIIVEGKRSWGRQRRTWQEQIKNDLHDLHLSEDLTRDRGNWRRLIHVSDYWCSFAYQLMLLFFAFAFLYSILLFVFFSWVFKIIYVFVYLFICFKYWVFFLSIHLWIISSRGTLWPHSPLWVWVIAFRPFPDPNHIFLRAG